MAQSSGIRDKCDCKGFKRFFLRGCLNCGHIRAMHDKEGNNCEGWIITYE